MTEIQNNIGSNVINNETLEGISKIKIRIPTFKGLDAERHIKL